MTMLLLAVLSVASVNNTDCEPLPGWRTVAEQARGSILVFGELHGTAESPEAVAEYVCAVSGGDDSVLLAIEFSASRNDGFQAAWAAEPEQFRSVLFERVPAWGEREDGVASKAMLEMLERLHTLKAVGRDIDIVAFNGARDDEQRERFAKLPGQEPHEAAQAENIRTAASASDYDHVVVLVGNLHARKTMVEGGSRGGPWPSSWRRQIGCSLYCK